MTDFTNLPLADDVIDAVAKWQGWLKFEKRAAKHTIESYQFDLTNLFRFRDRTIECELLLRSFNQRFRSPCAVHTADKHKMLRPSGRSNQTAPAGDGTAATGRRRRPARRSSRPDYRAR